MFSLSFILFLPTFIDFALSLLSISLFSLSEKDYKDPLPLGDL